MPQNNELVAELKSIGLSDKAAAVYAAILELGIAFPSKISEITKLNRSTVYHILTDLSIKGLVTEIERGKKLCYQVERPSKLVGFAKNQIRVAEDRAERAAKLLPEIEGLFSLSPHKPRVRFFEGRNGVLAVYEEHVAETKPYEMVAFSNVEKLMQQLPRQFVSEYIAKKDRLSITTRAIFPATKFSERYNKEIYRGAGKKTYIQIRMVPPATFPFQSEITIFGDNKISIVNFEQQTMMGVIIEDATITGMMRMIFELAWNGAEKKISSTHLAR